MKTLTADQVQFIDTYLTQIGVEYEDIRYEMTDHVASALEEMEGDFMERFKIYMLQNKETLLTESKTFGWQAGKRAMKIFLRTLINPYVLFAFTLIFVVLNKMYTVFGIDDVQYGFSIMFTVLYFVSCYPVLKGRITGKREYSVAFKVINLPGLAVFMLHLIINPLYGHMPLWMAMLLQSFCLGYIVAMIVARVRVKKQYARLYVK